MADRLPAIDTSKPVGQRFPVEVRAEVVALAASSAPVTSVEGRTGDIILTPFDVGLGEVVNLAPEDLPVSEAQLLALNSKVDKVGTANRVYATNGSGGETTLTYTGASASANTLAYRGTGGVLKVGTPVADADAATRLYVDTAVAAGVSDGGVTTVKLADLAVTTAKLADGSVTSAKIVDGTIVAADLADGAVTSAKILDNTIVNADISSSANIAGSKLSNLGVSTAKIADAAITTIKIADANVTAAKLAADVTTAMTGLINANAVKSTAGIELVVQAGAPSGAPATRVTIRTS